MKGFRRSLVGIIILALLGGYYYFYEIRYRGQKAREKELQQKIFPVKKKAITKIVYQKGKQTIVLVKKGKIWKIVRPVQARADQKVVRKFLDTFPELKSFRKLADVKWDNPQFGLKKTPVRITFYDHSGKKFTALFGNKNPTNSYYYTLKDGRKTVLLTWIYPDSLLNKSVYDFRFKKILALPADQVLTVHFQKKDLDLVLEQKKKHHWKILKPIVARGDRYAIEAFLSTATDEKVIRFLDNPPRQPALFGWDQPRMKLTLTWRPGKKKKEKTTTLLVGKNRDEGHVYVKIAGRPTVMIVKNGYVKELDKNLFNFRDKNVWNYEIDDVTAVTYENPADHVIIAASKSSKDNHWYLTKPRKVQADTRAVENWLWDLSGFRIKKFLTRDEFVTLAHGRIPPVSHHFTVTIKGKTPALTLSLYHVEDQWIAQSGRDPKWYDVLDPKDVPKTFKTAFELQYRRLLQFEDTDITRLELKEKGKTLLYKKKKNRWYQVTKKGKKKIPNIDVLNFLWELSDLKYTKLLEKTPENVSFSKGVEVRLFEKNSHLLGNLTFINPPHQQGLLFQVEGKKKLYFIDKKGTKKFEDAYQKLAHPQKKKE